MPEGDDGDRPKPNEVIIYTGRDGDARVQLRFTGDDLWMTQLQMGKLFGVTRENVNIHLANIYSEGELEQGATCKESLHVQVEGRRQVERKTLLYNLDAIISVGYRVSSKEATRFRIWATGILREYAVKGHVVDVERLKDPEASDYFRELLEKIRDIRASEKHVWKRMLELASLCSDYTRVGAQSFFQTIQNMLHWGVVHATAAEIIHARVDARQPHCGLTHFQGSEPTLKEAHIAKNYLGKAELEELSLLTNRLLDYFEDQSRRRLVVTLADFEDRLAEFMNFDRRPVLRHRRSIRMEDAKAKAGQELGIYKAQIRTEQEERGEAALRDLEKASRSIGSAAKGRAKTTQRT
jgi:hypothetical protein